MKVNGNESSALKGLVLDTATEAKTKPSTKVGNPLASGEDTVTIGAAKDLLNFLNTESEKELRAARVQELKALYQSGKYQPDSRLVATALDSEINLEVLTSQVRWKEDE